MGSVIAGVSRIEGWEDRLAAAVAVARSRPYQLGEHDCFRFACAAIEALIGIDLWPRFKGQYATRAQAVRAIATYGSNFTAAASAFFGMPPARWQLARRGDLLEFEDAQGEKHLGVCLGADVAVLGETGLLGVPLNRCSHCWRIG